MTADDFSEFVSQAEEEGVTLAEIISRTLSAEQLNELQNGLRLEMTANHSKIEGFMSEVTVPSIEEMMAMDSLAEHDSIASNVLFENDLSDDASADSA